MEENIKIIITNIEVDDGYYGFDYKVTSDKGRNEEDRYESDYCNGCSKKEWVKELEDGYAVGIVCEILGE